MCLTIELKIKQQETGHIVVLVRLFPCEGHKGKSTVAKS